jgi:hypothetical protein
MPISANIMGFPLIIVTQLMPMPEIRKGGEFATFITKNYR